MDSQPPKAALPPGYPFFLKELKERIRFARFRVALTANRELILLYWDLGRRIVEKQKLERWGSGVIVRISQDLRAEFPRLKGFSPNNIWHMRAFYLAWADATPILQQPVGELDVPKEFPTQSSFLPHAVAELPWGHNAVLIEKLKTRKDRLWYATKALEHGWPRIILIKHIKARLHERLGKAQTNFSLTLPAPQAKRARKVLKDEYALDFLAPGITQEKDIEQGIIENAQRFLMEFGTGFAFIGRQQRLKAGDREHVIDLLLYHTFLHCYVVVELKAGAFEPQHTGALSAYIGAADRQLRQPGDNASIGVILCRTKDRIAVEFALRDQRRPMGVASYLLTKKLPQDLRAALPTARQLENGLGS